MANDLLGSLYGDDILGDEMGEDGLGDILGQRQRLRAGGKANWFGELKNGAPGAPPVSEKMYTLAFNSVVFNNSSGNALTATSRPQLAVRPERPVVIVTRSLGAGGIGVSISDIKVGQRSQLANSGEIPAEMFAPTAFGVRQAYDPCGPGIDVSIFYATTATPAAGETITVLSSLVARAAG
jgi:hypothetical protein